VRCQDCGPVEVAAADVRLAVSAQAGRSFYTFRCPGCARTERRGADQRMVEVLRAAGVVAIEVHV
jgi:hypothetical protein